MQDPWKAVVLALALMISLGSVGVARANGDAASTSALRHGASAVRAEAVPMKKTDRQTRLKHLILLWLLTAQAGK
jgi:hypothetical protein